MKYKKIIGIDPGTDTGLAIWDVEAQQFSIIITTKIHVAMDIIRNERIRQIQYDILIRIEDARKRKWFGETSREVLQGAGSIKRDCAIWEDFCKYWGLDYQLMAPQYIKTKVGAEYFRQLTGWAGKTSEHARDAAMLVYGYK